MVTMTTAENALKEVYLDVVSNQLNTETNALYNQIKNSTADVYGRQVQKLVPYGVNGGIGAGDEGGVLPKSNGNGYLTFSTTLKNLFGTIEISDKAIRASKDDAGAFVNLLNAEMEGLLSASKFNLGRMLYGDGTGLIATVSSAVLASGLITVSDVTKIVEGMIVDFYNSSGAVSGFTSVRIASVDRANKKIKLATPLTSTFVSGASAMSIYVQNSKDAEISGLEKIFATSGSIYGLNRQDYDWLNSYQKAKGTSDTFDQMYLQTAIDEVAERTGNDINFLVTTSAVKRKFADTLINVTKNIDVTNLAGGYTSLSFNGIPLVSDKFVPTGVMYMLNTNDFTMHQLCDWEWLTNEDGSILKQKEGYARYFATLVKYAELVCNKPGAQCKLSGLA